MKRILNRLLFPALTTMLLSMGACNEWTEPESLGQKYPTLEEQNPALYRQYLEALRNYKSEPHQVTLVRVPGSDVAPAQRNEHLTTLPDSVDYICLTRPAVLHPTLLSEFEKVREKGTRMLYAIDYASLEARWKQILEGEAAAKPEEPADPDSPEPTDLEPEPEPEEPTVESRFLAFCKEQTELQFTYCDRDGYDGVVVSYIGRVPESLNPDELAIYTARQQTFLACVTEWLDAHTDKDFIFECLPQHLLDQELLSRSTYLSIPALEATSAEKLTFILRNACVAGVPTDRFLIGVMAPSMTDASDERGYFAGMESDGKTRLKAVKGAAQWAILPSGDYVKAGVSVANAQDDYYNLTLAYRSIREAIAIMNPAPKN